VPIVAAVISDPVTEGFVQSLARPGGNITGMAFQNPELTAKRLELLKRVIPKARRIAVLVDSTFGPSAGLQGLQVAARSRGLELQILEVRGPADFGAAFRSARNAHAEGLVVLASPLLNAHRKSLIRHAANSRLPATYEVRGFVEDGGLMSYGPDFADMYRRSATYVDKILRGAKPADLPVEQASRFDLVVNLRTAKALGLTIPESILLTADEVIR
jgi:putative ABC transport system substrate-binding protein